jgi:hypothetical protein
MRHTACLFVVMFLAASSAQAQPRLYAGVSTAADAGVRGNIPGGSVPSVGALFGLRLSEAWAVEVEVERGFRTTHAGSGEAVLDRKSNCTASARGTSARKPRAAAGRLMPYGARANRDVSTSACWAASRRASIPRGWCERPRSSHR